MDFSGDIASFNENQINLLKDIIQNQGFDVCKVKIEPAGKKGDNYGSAVVRVTADDNAGKTLKMIAKVAPTQELIREKMSFGILFDNEILMYEQVLPKIVSLQKSAGLPESELFKYPKFYGAISQEPEEFIVLEDLKVSGFDMRDRMTSLTNIEVKMVLNNLAGFHAASYSLISNEPDLFDKLKHKLVDIWSTQADDLERKAIFSQMEQGFLSFFETEEQKMHLKGVVKDMTKTISDLRRDDLDSKYTALIQGDCWTNNIMFRQEEEKLHCINIDYQMSRAAPPAQELLYFLFNCTDHETRSEHYSSWLDYYYKRLEDALLNYNMSVAEVYPRERLDADLRRHARAMLGCAMLLATMTMRESEEAMAAGGADMEKNMASGDFLGMKNVKEQSLVLIKKRLQGLWDSYSSYGYL